MRELPRVGFWPMYNIKTFHIVIIISGTTCRNVLSCCSLCRWLQRLQRVLVAGWGRGLGLTVIMAGDSRNAVSQGKGGGRAGATREASLA